MIPMLIGNMASGTFSMYKNLRGPNFATCSACRDGQSRHWRSLALHQNGRRAGDVRRRRGSDDRAHWHRRLFAP